MRFHRVVSFFLTFIFAALADEDVHEKKLSVEGRFIVLFDEANVKATSQSVDVLAANLASEMGATLGHSYSRLISGFSITDASKEAVSRLQRSSLVKEIIPDAIVEKSAIQTENLPWGLDRIDDLEGTDGSFEYPDDAGDNVHIYILDTGINVDHEEFVGRMAPDHEQASTLNFNLFSPPTPVWNDCDGHGSHVASTAAGTKYGVAKKAILHSIRVLQCDGRGYSSDVIAGMGEVDLQCRDGRLCVANLSFALSPNSVTDLAVNTLVESGVSVVAAAGGDQGDACNRSPGRAEKAIAVGSTAENDIRASLSNYGECLDMFAPGIGILGAGYDCMNCTEVRSGTSMAAAHVSGVAALILQNLDETDFFPATPENVLHRLRADALVGIVQDAGEGSPNLFLQMNTVLVSHPPSMMPSITPQPSDIASNAPSMDPTGSHPPSLFPSAAPSRVPSQLPTLVTCPAGETKFEIVIFTDGSSFDTYFDLVNTCTDENVLSVEPLTYSAYQSYAYLECLPWGRYEFTIRDRWGDGLDYPGSYKLYIFDELVKDNFRFDYSETTVFGDDDCITPAPTASHPPSLTPTESPEPSVTPYPTKLPSEEPSPGPTAAPTPFECGDGEMYVLIEIETDAYGSEISFDLETACTDEAVFSVPEYTLGNREFYSFPLCVEASAHRFVIDDRANDGISNPGYFRVSVDGVVIVDDPIYFNMYEIEFGEGCKCYHDKKELHIQLGTDYAGHETWLSVDSVCGGGSNVMTVSDGTLNDYSDYSYQMCVGGGEYRFAIGDLSGNGMGGTLAVTYGDELLVSNPGFGDLYAIHFGGDCPCPCNQRLLPLRLLCKFRNARKCFL